MSFLSRLFGKKPAFEDRVWLTREAKLDDLLGQVRADCEDGSTGCLVVHHFRETGDRLESRFAEAGLGYERLRKPGSDLLENLAERLGPGKLGLLGSGELPDEIQRGRGARSVSGTGTPCRVHLAEHYPIPSRDDHVLELDAILPPGSTFVCYVGLDEPWLGDVLGSSTRALMERLELRGDEPLTHPMIGKALRRAQAQLDGKRRGMEMSARSSEEWMQLNVPDR